MNDLIQYIQQEFDAIWMTHNLEAIMQRFADDAIVRTVPPLPGAPEQFVGKAQVQGFVQMLITNFSITSKNFRQQNDRVMWFATVSSDSVRSLGLPSMDADCEAIVHDHKVQSFLVTFTADTMARIAAAAASTQS